MTDNRDAVGTSGNQEDSDARTPNQRKLQVPKQEPVVKVPETQPLSARAYAFMALAAGIIGTGLLLFYVYEVPKLVGAGIQSQVFYVLLLPWGVSCAVALFGAIRSFARFQSQRFGGLLELGGPVVLFCAVVAGGFRLVPRDQSFDLTIRAHSADGRTPIIKTGLVTIYLENNARHESLEPDGEANFKGIPPQLWGRSVKVIPQVRGFREDVQTIVLARKDIDLALERDDSKTMLAGSIIGPSPKDGEVRLFVDGGRGEGTTDALGRFQFLVSGKDGDRIRLKVYSRGRLVYDEYQTLPGPLTISIASTNVK